MEGRFVNVVGVVTPGPNEWEYDREGAAYIFVENSSIQWVNISLEWLDDLPRKEPSRWKLAYGHWPNNVIWPGWTAGSSPIEISLNKSELNGLGYYYPIIRPTSHQLADVLVHDTMWWNATVTWDPSVNATHYQDPCETGDSCP